MMLGKRIAMAPTHSGPYQKLSCYQRLTATWRSGYATVCKTVYPGSIPGVASTKINDCTR